jgi:tRNA pseudouridine38-40 synthase
VTGAEASRRAYRIAYDGTDYHGFQRQPDVPTVSDAILDALRALDVLDAGVPDGYAAAGRTDAGVSASAQTVAFDAPEWLGPAALNAELPAGVRAWAHADVPSDFHATHDASAREYTYYLHAPGADAGVARQALTRLCGRHDFHNLTPDETGTVRDLSGNLKRDGPMLVVTVAADGFPRQLVRRLLTVIGEVANGERGLNSIDAILGDTPLTGPDGIAPAPPEPLVLTDVTYPDVHFETDPEAAASARSVFGRRHARLTARARVSERIRRDVR